MPIDDDGQITVSHPRTFELSPEPTFSSLNCPLREIPALDRPNQDRILKAWRLLEGSPEPGDSRLYLDSSALRYLLQNAESSPTKRAVIHGLRVDVELRVDSNGHRYQVLKFEGIATPEWSSADQRQITRAGG